MNPVKRTCRSEDGQARENVNPMVSVIVPAYNCEKTIGETIESVINQSYNNWELIIVNDCSNDNTVQVVDSYMRLDKRIRLINHANNLGPAQARNTAISNAKGRFLAMLDSDDLWKKEKLEKQISFMLENRYVFTFTSYEIFHESAELKRKVFPVPSSINYKQYLKNTIIGNLTVIIDRDAMKDFHIISGELEDVLTWMYYLHSGYIAYGLNENLASYRVSRNSQSGNKVKNARKYYKCLKEQPITPVERIICEIGYLFHAMKKRIVGKLVSSK